MYKDPVSIGNYQNGFRDILAVPDLKSFRRIPWENNVPFFLVRFMVNNKEEVEMCPRNTVRRVAAKLKDENFRGVAGGTHTTQC